VEDGETLGDLGRLRGHALVIQRLPCWWFMGAATLQKPMPALNNMENRAT
jgi:hypothetical protein